MTLRAKFVLALAGGIAASAIQVTPASATCSSEWKKVTGHCNPCITVAKAYYTVTGDYLFCPA